MDDGRTSLVFIRVVAVAFILVFINIAVLVTIVIFVVVTAFIIVVVVVFVRFGVGIRVRGLVIASVGPKVSRPVERTSYLPLPVVGFQLWGGLGGSGFICGLCSE